MEIVSEMLNDLAMQIPQKSKDKSRKISNAKCQDSAALAQSISRLSRMIRLPAVLSAFEYREKS